MFAKYWPTILFLCISTHSIRAQSPGDSLTKQLTDLHARSLFPGFSVAIVRPDTVLYQQGFGLANLQTRTPYTPHTVQSVGSISKTLIGVSLMQGVERGLFTLDTPINALLPFRVVNPYFPTDTIRIRHLATHTSGLVDYEPVYAQTYVFNGNPGTVPASQLKGYDLSGKNAAETLRSFLFSCFNEKGSRYTKRNFARTKAGQTYAYSNLGAALAALVIETKIGISYADYTRRYILDPLGMAHSGWSSMTLDPARQAGAYNLSRQLYPGYSSITYPDGNLRTSCADLGRYFMAMLRGYAGQAGILTPASFQQMLSPQFPVGKLPGGLPARDVNQGIFWVFRSNGSIGHTGSDFGASAFMFFNPQTGTGRLFMTNTDMENDSDIVSQFSAIWKLLGEYEGQLAH
ncbi:serine hydrolase domain-containing protein [Spirosoma rigui]|uniref:serine hydrolase domain-containing protein n=1 Tax=Spirosoma rigui TaxID=564064 RepID=UPI0009B1915A|nr:serine hydrolase domain-containing protein [Spirosoma rigui]